MEFNIEDLKAVNPELDSNRTKLRPIGSNLVDSLKDEVKTNMLSHVVSCCNSLDEKMEIDPTQYFGYRTLAELLDEYDRCYGVLLKSKLKSYDYKGESTMVNPDFHRIVHETANALTKMYLNIPNKFGAICDNPKYRESSTLAQLIVKKSMSLAKIEENFKEPSYDLSNYGFTIIQDDMVVEECEQDVCDDTLVDKNGFEVRGSDGQPIKDPKGDSWKKKLKQKVYTKFEEIDPRNLKFDPSIKNIKKQPFIAKRLVFTVDELQDMEEHGEISGLAQLLAGHDSEDLWEDSPDHEEKIDGQHTPESIETRTITACFFYWNLGDRLEKFIALVGNSSLLLSIKKCPYKTWPFISAELGISKKRPAIPMGMGQTIYMSFAYLNTRWNQMFDKGSLETLGGGIKNSRLPNFGIAKPGVWHNVAGYSATKDQVTPWSSLFGAGSSNFIKDIESLKSNLNMMGSPLAGGNSVGAPMERSGKAMDLMLNQSQSMKDVDFVGIENSLFRQLAEDTYDNAVMYLRDSTSSREEVAAVLTEWLGEDALTYIGPATEQNPEGIYRVNFPSEFPPVDFRFTGATEAMKKLENINNMQRVAETVAQFANVIPKAVEDAMGEFSLENYIKELMYAVDLKPEKFFPKYNPSAKAAELEKLLPKLAQEAQFAKDIIAQLTEYLIQNSTIDDAGQVQQLSGQEVLNKMRSFFEGLREQSTSKNR